jgi:hypothetical protein
LKITLASPSPKRTLVHRAPSLHVIIVVLLPSRKAIMPHGKKWTSDECRCVAIAVMNASENRGEVKPSGADQKFPEFLKKVMTNLQALAPPGADMHHYHHRGTDPVYAYWRDHMKPNMNKFNTALRKVEASHPTGVDKQQKINMAVAIHLGKTDRMDYKYKDFSADEWLYFKAWNAIKNCPKFQPPQGNAASRVLENAAAIAVTPNIVRHSISGCQNDSNPREENEDPMSPVANIKGASRGHSKGKKVKQKEASGKRKSSQKLLEIKKLRKVLKQRQEQQNRQTRLLELRTILEVTESGTAEHENAIKELLQLSGTPMPTTLEDTSDDASSCAAENGEDLNM